MNKTEEKNFNFLNINKTEEEFLKSIENRKFDHSLYAKINKDILGSILFINDLLLNLVYNNKLNDIKYLVENGIKITQNIIETSISLSRFNILSYFIDNKLIENIHSSNDYLLTTSCYRVYDKKYVEFKNKTDFINKQVSIVEKLIDYGADIHVRCDNPLYNAVYYNNIKLVKLLIEKGADLNNSDSPYNILCISIDNGNYDIFKLLIDNGYNLSDEILKRVLYHILKNKNNNKYYKFLKLLLINNIDTSCFSEPKDEVSIYIINKLLKTEIRYEKLCKMIK